MSVSPVRVSWLPAHPTVGGMSMQRYWYFLWQASQRAGDFTPACILGEPGSLNGDFRRPSAVKQNIVKYFSYPLRIKLQEPSGIHHVLDHSWAHLVKSLPANEPRIVTVHDLIPFRFPGSLSSAQLQRWRWVVGHLKQFDCILADSNYTKSEVVELLGIEESKVQVVPLGVDVFPAQDPPLATEISQQIQKLRSTGAELIVGCLGAAVSRKNLQTAAKAVSLLNARGVPVGVVRAGPPAPDDFAQEALPLVSAGRFTDLGGISDSQVHEFFAAIDVLLMPSLYEGFGLPVLEAMAAGVPVICSNTSSLPEVAGEAALLFNPESIEELCERIIVFMDPEQREHYKFLGRARAAAFSWDRSLKLCRLAYDGLRG